MNTVEAGSGRQGAGGRGFRIVALGTAVAATLGAAGCSAAPDASQQETLTVGWLYPVGVAQSYDPAVDGWNGDSIAQACVYDSLLHLDFTKDEWIHFAPGLATDWKISSDLTSIELELREGVTFTDGVKLDAEAVKANIEYTNQQVAWPAAEVEILDEYRVRLDFSERLSPTAPGGMLQKLQELQIVSPGALEDRDRLAENPVGTGPYTLNMELTTPGVEYVCERIDDYWDVESFPFETIVVRQYADIVAATNALKSGQIDMTAIDATVAAELEGEGFTIVGSQPSWSGLQIGDKTGAIVPALADIRVRQAMNYAFDRETIAETVDGGYAVATNQAYSAIWPEYLPGRTDDYAYDLEKARELMAEAGYADGFDLVIPQYGPGTKYDPIIAQSLGEIGIRVSYASRQDGLADYASLEYAVFVWQAAPYEITTRLFVSAENTAYNAWPTGESVTADLIETTKFGDAEESNAAAQELGNYLLDQAWFVPLTSPESLIAVKPGIVADFYLDLGPYLATIRPE
jgi:peptide/nickel transport system substrate-binding protein